MSENTETLGVEEFNAKHSAAEMRARFTYADGVCRMAWDAGDVWIETRDTSVFLEDRTNPRFCRKATADVAAATAALIIAGDLEAEHGLLCNMLYALAEPFWAGVPQNLRPIP